MQPPSNGSSAVLTLAPPVEREIDRSAPIVILPPSEVVLVPDTLPGPGHPTIIPTPDPTVIPTLDPTVIPTPTPTVGTGDELAGGHAEAPRHVSWRRILLEWTVVLVGAVGVFTVINTFLIQAFKIPSESMVPTLEVGDRVLVNKLSYDFHDLNRGDIIVFERPPNAIKTNEDDPDDLIKRVIGLPGDRIIAQDGMVYVNDRRLVEPYLPDGTTTDNLDTAVTVPPGKIFVMGDNRSNSSDSRFIGPIDSSLVIGRAFARVWPLNRMGSL